MTLTRPTSAIARLAARYYNENAVSGANPGGLDESDDGLTAGHVTNFPAALVDLGVVAGYVGDAADTIFAAQSTLALIWDTGTADANPGVGKVGASTAALTSGGYTLYVSTTDAVGGDATAVLADYGASTSAIKGKLRLVKIGASAVYIDLNVTGVTTATGYRKIAVTYLAGPGGFAAGDAVAVGFVQTGGKGDVGLAGSAGADGVNGAGAVWYGTSTGSANAQQLAGPLASLTGHPSVEFIAGYTNTAALTLTVGSAPSAPLRDSAGAAFVGGEITAGVKYTATYDGAVWRVSSGGGLAAASVSETAAGLASNKAVTPAALAGWVAALSALAYGGVDPVNDRVAILDVSTGFMRSVAPQALTAATATSANTWNSATKGADITLSSGNLRATVAVANSSHSVLALVGKSAGKWYWEVVRVAGGSDGFVGVGTASMGLTNCVGRDANGYSYYSGGGKLNNTPSGGGVAYGAGWTIGDVTAIALDLDNGKIWFRLNGAWQGLGDPATGANPAFSGLSGTFFAAVSGTGTGAPAYDLRPSPSGWLSLPPPGFIMIS